MKVIFLVEGGNPRQPCSPASVVKEFCGLRWEITPTIQHEKQQTQLTFKFDCQPANRAIPDWSYDAILEFCIIPMTQEPKKVVGQRRHVFRASSHVVSIGCPVDKLPKYSDDDGRYVAQISISMNSLSELRPMPSFVFDAPTEMSNLEVEVGKRRFYVKKEFLSFHSPALADALRAEPVSFPDVSAEDFEAMLRNLYPSRCPVNESNVFSLLRMAERFEIWSIFDESSRFLDHALESRVMDRSQIVDLAVRFGLNSLMEKVFSDLENLQDIVALTAEDSYHKMSSETRALLFDNIIKMLPKPKAGLFSAFRLNTNRRNKQFSSSTPDFFNEPRSYTEFSLNDSLMMGVRNLGWETLTEIQDKCFEIVFSKLDLVVLAKTGSGKTGCYGVPLIANMDLDTFAVQALIVVPTNEKAMRISKILGELAKHTHIRVICTCEGTAFQRDVRLLNSLSVAHMVVGTPFRLVRLLDHGALKLGCCRSVVFVDSNIFTSGTFEEKVHRIFKDLPSSRQIILVSREMPEPLDVFGRYMANSPYMKTDCDQKAAVIVNAGYCFGTLTIIGFLSAIAFIGGVFVLHILGELPELPSSVDIIGCLSVAVVIIMVVAAAMCIVGGGRTWPLKGKR